LDGRLLAGLEVDVAPLQLEARRRFPGRDLADDVGLRPRRQLEGLKQPAADAGLEAELAALPTRYAELPPAPPPEIGLAREHVEGVVGWDRDEDRGACRVAGHVFLPRVRSACSLNAASSPAQKASTSSSQRPSSRNGAARRR